MIGQNKKEAEDFQDITALLRDLPRVNAPANFDASLKARIAAAQSTSSEFADVTTLLKELPRVQAPADFDFKLRARIARAQAQEEKRAMGWFGSLFGHSFSLVQAGATLVIVGAIVTGLSIKLLNPSSVPATNSEPQVIATNRVEPQSSIVVPDAFPLPAQAAARSARASSVLPVNNLQPERAVRVLNAGLKASLPANTRPVAALTVANTEVASVVDPVMIKHTRSGSERMVKLVSYGQQAALAPAASTRSVNDEVATMIY